ncbi:hypothetical protein C8R46DRAFT_1034726 [Mycena filopes]|nr:hypothetical protein C8R46DRAFT_1034726 [Mycena filopes]
MVPPRQLEWVDAANVKRSGLMNGKVHSEFSLPKYGTRVIATADAGGQGIEPGVPVQPHSFASELLSRVGSPPPRYATQLNLKKEVSKEYVHRGRRGVEPHVPDIPTTLPKCGSEWAPLPVLNEMNSLYIIEHRRGVGFNGAEVFEMEFNIASGELEPRCPRFNHTPPFHWLAEWIVKDQQTSAPLNPEKVLTNLTQKSLSEDIEAGGESNPASQVKHQSNTPMKSLVGNKAMGTTMDSMLYTCGEEGEDRNSAPEQHILAQPSSVLEFQPEWGIAA